jgi:hypothetical protein
LAKNRRAMTIEGYKALESVLTPQMLGHNL